MGKMIRWGILGAGNIAHRFADSLKSEKYSRLVAISGRSPERLEAFRAEYGVASDRVYTSYEDLLADKGVDAIYLALPHGLHAEWACRALHAGKAVLCEKPAALSAAQVEAIAEASCESGKLFMEAMKPRFVPLHDEVLTILTYGDLGKITSMEICQHVPMDFGRGGYIVDPVQGGVLYDMGIYGASWVEELLPGAIKLKDVEVRREEDVDVYDCAHLLVGDVPVDFEVSGEPGEPRSLCRINCEDGRIDIDRLHRPEEAVIYQSGKNPECLVAPYLVDDFYDQIHHFVECLHAGLTESPVMPIASSVRAAELLDVIRALA